MLYPFHTDVKCEDTPTFVEKKPSRYEAQNEDRTYVLTNMILSQSAIVRFIPIRSMDGLPDHEPAGVSGLVAIRWRFWYLSGVRFR